MRAGAGRLGEDSAEFPTGHLKVVRPLQVDAKAARLLDAFRDGDAGGERQERRRARRVDSRCRGRQHHRHVKARARRREPRVAAPSAARRLLVGDHNEALDSSGHRDIVGRTDRVEVEKRGAETPEAWALAPERAGELARNGLRVFRPAAIRRVRFQS